MGRALIVLFAGLALFFGTDARSHPVLTLDEEARVAEHRAVFAGGGAVLATSHADDTLQIWDLEEGRRRHRIELSGAIWDLAPVANGNALALIVGEVVDPSEPARVSLWLVDVGTGHTYTRFDGLPISQAGFRIRHTADGRHLWLELPGYGAVVEPSTGEVIAQYPPTGSSAVHGTRGVGLRGGGDDKYPAMVDLTDRSIIWQHPNPTPLAADFRLSPSGDRVAIGMGGRTLLLDAASGEQVAGVRGADPEFTPQGLVTKSQAFVGVFDPTTGDERQSIEGQAIGALANDGRWYGSPGSAESGGMFSAQYARPSSPVARIWDLKTGRLRHELTGPPEGLVTQVAMSEHANLYATTAMDGAVRLWRSSTGERLVTLLSLANGAWVVMDADGRFDTDDLGELDALRWTRADDATFDAPVLTLAGSRYVPALWSRISRGEDLGELPAVDATSRVTPEVSLTARAEGPGLEIAATVCAAKRGREESGARDLRVYVDGQLAFWVDGPLRGRCPTITRVVAVPRHGRPLEVTARAFDQRGTASDEVRLEVAHPTPALRPKRRAFTVHIGVERYAGVEFDPLSFTGADARAMAGALAPLPGHEVHQVVLTSDGDAPPTRSNIERVLATLAGTAEAPPWARGFTRATPDDTVIVTFAGHGYSPDGEEFHLVLDDTARGSGEQAWRPFAISDQTLAGWLRPVRAANLALVVDACQSAAAVVGEGFRPGPTGSQGLGQLAYDKGILVLAASQVDQFAFERSGNGVLTSALVNDGLHGRRANVDGQPGITLREWLAYGEPGVVAIDGTARSGRLDGRRARRVAQQPRLFAYRDLGEELYVLAPEDDPPVRDTSRCGNGRPDPLEECDLGPNNGGLLGGCTRECELPWTTVPAGTYAVGPGTMRLASPLEVLPTEVTEQQLTRFAIGPERRRPATATWARAKQYCEAVGGRLPTEAEWELLARADRRGRFPCGDDPGCLDGIAWHAGNLPPEDGFRFVGEPVATRPANALGLYDLVGNVQEWALDCYAADPWTVLEQPHDTVVRDHCQGTYMGMLPMDLHVRRGGGVQDPPARLAFDVRDPDVLIPAGFRCVRGPEPRPIRVPGTPDPSLVTRSARRAQMEGAKAEIRKRQAQADQLEAHMGDIQEALREMQSRAVRGQLLLQATRQFGPLTEAQKVRIVEAGPDELRRWFGRLADASSFAEIVAE